GVPTVIRAVTFPHQVVLDVGKATHLLSETFGFFQLASNDTMGKLTHQNWSQLCRSIQLLAELTRECIRLAGLRCGVSLGRKKRVAECDLQIELPLLARGCVGDAGKELQ